MTHSSVFFRGNVTEKKKEGLGAHGVAGRPATERRDDYRLQLG